MHSGRLLISECRFASDLWSFVSNLQKLSSGETRAWGFQHWAMHLMMVDYHAGNLSVVSKTQDQYSTKSTVFPFLLCRALAEKNGAY